MDDASVDRCEYRDGTIVCMPGGTEPHALVTANIGRSIGNRTERGPCRVYSPDLRIGIPRRTCHVYPDVPVVSGPAEFGARDLGNRTVTNPRLVVEVVSPSTEAYDRGAKFQRYTLVDSLQEYVLGSQDQSRARSYFGRPDGTWTFSYATGVEAGLLLRSLDIDLPLSTVYTNVTFPPPPPEEAPKVPSRT